MWWPLAFTFLRCLITGDLWKLWQEHRDQVKAQAVADAPQTKKELIDDFEKGNV